MGDNAANAVFPPTHWSVVINAREADAPRAAQALESLARAYWRPLYVFARRRGLTHEEGADAIQGFFAHLLARDFLRAVRPGEGRFRTFLLACLKNWLADDRARERASKRGGGREFLSLEQLEEARDAGVEGTSPPEESFDRDWALNIVGRALSRLGADWAEKGRGELFSALRGALEGEAAAQTHAEIGARLGMTPNAVKCAALDLRRRYAQLVRAEIQLTVRVASEVEDELRYLIRQLRA